MATDFDITNLYQKWIELDRELKLLKQEIGEIKRFQPIAIGPIEFGQQRILHRDNDKPAQWPNESYTDYLKRIGEYNEAMNYEDDTK